jgi:hypothetical protein
MTMRRLSAGGVLGLGVLVTTRCLAADASLCITIVDPAARLTCYDAALRPAGAPAVQPPAAVQHAPTAPSRSVAGAAAASGAPAPTPAPSPAKSSGVLSAFGLAPKASKSATDRVSLKASVVDVQMRAEGQVITLDNEQVWQITDYRPDPFVKVHDAIEIIPASMGSFLLSRVQGGGGVRVRRLR